LRCFFARVEPHAFRFHPPRFSFSLRPMALRIIFMGTPDLAAVSLKALLEHRAFEVSGVVTVAGEHADHRAAGRA
jgi:hypothetical protein